MYYSAHFVVVRQNRSSVDRNVEETFVPSTSIDMQSQRRMTISVSNPKCFYLPRVSTLFFIEASESISCLSRNLIFKQYFKYW